MGIIRKRQGAIHVIAGLALTLLAAANGALAASSFTGEVVRVLDGDTIEVLVNRKPTRVRLANIDAPEKAQAFGERSRQALAAQVFRKQVQIIDQGGDRYGRRIGVVMVEGRNANTDQVRTGMAWVYQRYNSDRALPGVEQQARSARVGLWIDASPVPPWEFRRAR